MTRSAFDILFDAALPQRDDVPADERFDAALRAVPADDLPADVKLDIAIGLASPPPAAKPPRDTLFDAAMLQSKDLAPTPDEILHAQEQQSAAEFNTRRVAAGTAHEVDRPIRNEWRDWDISLGPMFSPAGTQNTAYVNPQCLFKAEKVMATDSGTPAGSITRVMRVTVGNHNQRPGGDRGTLTSMFAPTALANGIKFDTAQEWATIAVTVSFIQSGTFELTLFGKALLP